MAIDDFWQHKVMKDSNTPPANLKTSSRKIQVKKSGIHGKGVFAARDISKGETLIEYVGEIISAQEAEDRHHVALREGLLARLVFSQDIVSVPVTAQRLIRLGQFVGIALDVDEAGKGVLSRPGQGLVEQIDRLLMVAAGGGEGRDIVRRLIAQVLPWVRLHDRDGEHLSGVVLGLMVTAEKVAGAGQVSEAGLERRVQAAHPRLLAAQIRQGELMDPDIVFLRPAEGDETAAGQFHLGARVAVALRDRLQATLELRVGLLGLLLRGQHLRARGDVQGTQVLSLLPVVLIALLATGSLHGDLRNLGWPVGK